MHIKLGQDITPNMVVASTNLPGNVQMVKLSNILNIEPKDVENALKVKRGRLSSKRRNDC